MKVLVIFCVLVIKISTVFGQNNGKIISELRKPHPGILNKYVYTPPQHLAIPDKLFAQVGYSIKEKSHFKKVPLLANEGKYIFYFKAPDSADVLIIGINDEKNNPFDNNNDLSFISWLYDKNGNIPASAKFSAAVLLSFDAIRPLKLDYTKLRPLMIKLLEDGYKISASSTKPKPYYMFYLKLLYEEKGKQVIPRLLSYATEMASASHDELKWSDAMEIYHLLAMSDKLQTLQDKAINTFPNGKVAKDKYVDEFNRSDTTEELMLSALKEYLYRFNDSSAQTNYTFYSSLMTVAFSDKHYDVLPGYEAMLSKYTVVKINNEYALEFSGGDKLENHGTDMAFAKSLARRDMDILNFIKEDSASYDDDNIWQILYAKYTSTYGLILYKTGQYDSAFYYQDAVYRQGHDLKTVDIERYIAYAEKAKGAAFAYRFTVDQLLHGISSEVITAELQRLAEKAGIPNTVYDSLKKQSIKLTAEIEARNIKKKFGSIAGRKFKLKNLKGQLVTLESLRNKIVVLDFWATWCLSCRASFPAMKTVIDKYKNDSDIVFLFIDVWEHKDREKMKLAAVKLLKDNDYDFNVLLDELNETVSDYKIEYIPTRYIINKRGDIVSTGESANFADDIENARN